MYILKPVTDALKTILDMNKYFESGTYIAGDGSTYCYPKLNVRVTPDNFQLIEKTITALISFCDEFLANEELKVPFEHELKDTKISGAVWEGGKYKIKRAYPGFVYKEIATVYSEQLNEARRTRNFLSSDR